MNFDQQEQSRFIKIISRQEIESILITEELQAFPLQKFIEYFLKLFSYAYSPKMHLYKLPLASYNKLDYLKGEVSIGQLNKNFGSLCLTFNNRQYLQQQKTNGFTMGKNDLTLIIQTCSNNIFSHDLYKIDIKSTIILITSVSQRYGNQPFIQYYTFRIPLEWFKNTEIIEQVLLPFVIDDNLTITIDQHHKNAYYSTALQTSMINHEEYNIISLVDYNVHILNNKASNFQSVLYILNLIYKHSFTVLSSQKMDLPRQQKREDKELEVIQLVKQQGNNFLIEINLNPSVFVGSNRNYIIFISNNNIAHIFSSRKPFPLLNSYSINPLNHKIFQDYFAFLRDQFLIIYEVSAKAIELKYLKILSGEIKYLKYYRWDEAYGQVQIDSVDLFAVPLKNKQKIRVFYIDQPKNYLQIEKPEYQWKVFVNKLGLNTFSDQSNIFSIITFKIHFLQIFNLRSKEQLFSLRLANQQLIQSIRFNALSKEILINTKQNCNTCHKINLKTNNFANLKKQSQEQTYCFDSDHKIIILHENYIRFENGSKKRMNQCLIVSQDGIFTKSTPYTFNIYKQIIVI